VAVSPFAQPYPDAPSLQLFEHAHADGQCHPSPSRKVMIVLPLLCCGGGQAHGARVRPEGIRAGSVGGRSAVAAGT
jgi:hypothetical protein